MSERISVAVVDYHMGNVLSVYRACEAVGLSAVVTSDASTINLADGVILPGVGAFGDAMASIRSLGLDEILRRVSASGKPILGICLGMQLLMTQSEEFGFHDGLNLIAGRVIRFDQPRDQAGRVLKVPHVGWNSIHPPSPNPDWDDSILEGLNDAAEMYFVHSYFVIPEDPTFVRSISRYGQFEFASVIQSANLMTCQFHPENSGTAGLRVYRNFRRIVQHNRRRCCV
jgi:glutamine amidotransferase